MHHYQKLCKKLFLKKKLVYSPYAFPEYLKPIPNTNTRAKTISFLVSLTKEYGIFDFLNVIYEMTKERKDFQARIIGQGPEENNVRTLINELGISDRVTLTGYVEETSLGTELNKSDVFISPMTESAKDIFRCPSKIYYYLPYEKPIVTCRVGEVPHALADYGYYYQPGDSADMKRALYEALSFKGNLYPPEFVQNNSWKTRAKQFINDISY
jgi:glycosyltransferase involved in cell wall biosynthesis